MTTDAEADDRLPYRDPPDPDDVHTPAAEQVPDEVAARVAEANDPWLAATEALDLARIARDAADEAVAHLHLDLDVPIREVARRLGIPVTAVVLACRVRH